LIIAPGGSFPRQRNAAFMGVPIATLTVSMGTPSAPHPGATLRERRARRTRNTGDAVKGAFTASAVL
jgi:hypothetical protein